jgi:hypothetical protein
MATIGEIRTAIKTTFEANITGLNVAEFMGLVKVPPAIVPRLVDGDFDVAMGANAVVTWQWDLLVVASRANDTSAQQAIDLLIDGYGDRSIRAILLANKNLGLADGTKAHISGVSNYNAQFTGAGDIPYVGAVLRMAVHTKKP